MCYISAWLERDPTTTMSSQPMPIQIPPDPPPSSERISVYKKEEEEEKGGKVGEKKDRGVESTKQLRP